MATQSLSVVSMDPQKESRWSFGAGPRLQVHQLWLDVNLKLLEIEKLLSVHMTIAMLGVSDSRFGYCKHRELRGYQEVVPQSDFVRQNPRNRRRLLACPTEPLLRDKRQHGVCQSMHHERAGTLQIHGFWSDCSQAQMVPGPRICSATEAGGIQSQHRHIQCPGTGLSLCLGTHACQKDDACNAHPRDLS